MFKWFTGIAGLTGGDGLGLRHTASVAHHDTQAKLSADKVSTTQSGHTHQQRPKLRLWQHSFAHGIHPPDFKQSTRDAPIRRMPFAPQMIVPLQQHFGAPSLPLVCRGQEVVRGQPIALPDGDMSVALHAPVTGTVESISLMPTARGPKTPAIVIRTLPGDSQQIRWARPTPIETLSPAGIIQAVQAAGLVGLGGAGFPTHKKLEIPKEYQVDTLLVNGCECEPYLTADYRIMVEQSASVLRGVRLAMRALRTKTAVIGIEDDKPEAFDALLAHLQPTDSIRLQKVRTKYPQGSEKLLIKAVLKREVPSGGYPYQVGVVVHNVSTLALLGDLVSKGEGLIERVVTVTGPSVQRPGNYRVPLGTPLRFLLAEVGYTGDASRIILGGPMMGNSVASLDVPITKAVGGVVVLPEAKAHAPLQVNPCIRCGRCLQSCPVQLNPSELGRLARKREFEAMQAQFHLQDCFECGCCSYVCPSHIPLVQYFRIAKSRLRDH